MGAVTSEEESDPQADTRLASKTTDATVEIRSWGMVQELPSWSKASVDADLTDRIDGELECAPASNCSERLRELE